MKSNTTQFFQLAGFENMELSTQVLLRESFKRAIQVEVLDLPSHIIRLKKNDHIEYVRQATMTSKDSLISYFLMENKVITKRILAENGIRVPFGKSYTSKKSYTSQEAAIKDYGIFSSFISVVKPAHTNFGIGVHIVPVESRDVFERAVREAFQYDQTLIVEEFISGTEYRFLVIGNRVHAVLRRIPSNIIGDGKHTIRQLVAIKNKNPLRGEEYKCPLQFLQLEETETQVLAEQGLHFDSVIEKDCRIFLRKNSNISTGGDSVDMTDEIHKSYKNIAVQAVQTIGASICGLDMIIENIHIAAEFRSSSQSSLPEIFPSLKASPLLKVSSSLASSPSPENFSPLETSSSLGISSSLDAPPPLTYSGNYAIIELNFNPALHIHTYPSEGKSHDVAGPVLDLLGF